MPFLSLEVPTICTMVVLGGFDDDDELLAIAGSKRAAKEFALDSIRGELDCIWRHKTIVAATNDHHSFSAAALRSLRFRKVGTYRGQQGRITVWLKFRESSHS